MKKGYENTSVRDIYSQANGSFVMFYHHFRSFDRSIAEKFTAPNRTILEPGQEIVLVK